MTKKLLVSLHDVTPYHADKVSMIIDYLQNGLQADRFALLLVPDYHGLARLDSDPEFVRKIRRWSDWGCEIFLHGFYHQDRTEHAGYKNNFRARHLTAGEGEFLGIGRQEAVQLLKDGRHLVEDMIGKPATGFIAPAWLYGQEAVAAIAETGFDLSEDHFKVWNPQNNSVYARGPVVSYATRTSMRKLSSVVFARGATPLLKMQDVVRLAIHPDDWTSPTVAYEIAHTLNALVSSHVPSTYKMIVK